MIQPFNSKFVIDGIPQELTPAEILASILEKTPESRPSEETLLDETLDPAPGSIRPDPSKIDEYLSLVQSAEFSAPVPFADSYTRFRIAEALIDTMWRSGNLTTCPLRPNGKPLPTGWGTWPHSTDPWSRRPII